MKLCCERYVSHGNKYFCTGQQTTVMLEAPSVGGKAQRSSAIVHLGQGRDDLPACFNTMLFYHRCDGKTRMIFLANPVVYWPSLVTQRYRICLPMEETEEMQVRSLGWEDTLEEGMATHSSILAWRIP